MRIREYTVHRQALHVTFLIPDSLWVDHIAVVGDFNDWNRFSHLLETRRGEQHRSMPIACSSRPRTVLLTMF